MSCCEWIPALLIQNLEFQTIKCPSDVRSMYGKNGQNTQNMCAGQEDLLFAVLGQSIFKVSKKTEESRKRNDLAGP